MRVGGTDGSQLGASGPRRAGAQSQGLTHSPVLPDYRCSEPQTFGSPLPHSAVLRTSLTKSNLRISILIHSLTKKKKRNYFKIVTQT